MLLPRNPFSYMHVYTLLVITRCVYTTYPRTDSYMTTIIEPVPSLHAVHDFVEVESVANLLCYCNTIPSRVQRGMSV